MSYTKTHKALELLVLGIVCLAAPAVVGAAPAIQLSGAITGVVTNAAGAPQMGAAVVLYNHQDRVFQRALTDIRGEFHFSQLFPDLYSIRVSLASYIPALKKDILVQPGMRSILSVNLTTLFSSIQIGYPRSDDGTFMTDDWKWILRGAPSTRPVLRFTDPNAPGSQAPAFSDLRGVLQLSAGDGPLVTGIGSEADMGTAFALAASVFGNNQLQLSGDLGYGAQTGVPVTAFRTSYRSDGLEASVTMRQLYLPSHEAPLTGTDGAGVPALRSMSASMNGHSDLSDELSVQYGSTLDSVALFSDRLNYFSPYVRFVYTLDNRSDISFAYTSGNARPDLADNMAADSDDIQRDLSTVGLFPRLSLLGGAPKIQRGNEYELVYSRKMGSRKFALSGYHESVTNAALSLVAPDGFYTGGDLLPDLFTGDAIFNAGNYQNTGYSASITQDFGQNFSATLIYGTTGGLTAPGGELVSGSPDELRSMIRAARTQTVAERISATVPRLGTHLIASYEWMGNSRLLTPGRLYSTQSLEPMPGLNVYIRQPIPGLSMLPWRTEATIDLRNMLAQGYLPFGMIGGQQALLIQTPRALRGGLSFIF
jgi:hypothetical protein